MLTKNDVIQKATELFEGNKSAALNWCNEPNRALQLTLTRNPAPFRNRMPA